MIAPRLFFLLPLLLFAAAGALRAQAAADPQAVEFFEKQVRPILASNCYACHGPQKQFGGLRVDSRQSLLAGGAKGPALVPNDPAGSLLIQAVRHESLKMPMGGKLKDAEIAALEKWVALGAPWPKEAARSPEPDFYSKLIRDHWAFQPVRAVEPPPGEARNPVDRFLAAALGQAGLSMSAEADRRTLARRLSFVLTGLPPEPDAVEQFVHDAQPDAEDRFTDRLLASAHFGEQWARHWMDVMRFAETYGYEWNYEIHSAWRYRDYLIRAFNEDVPYDQLVREHIAGDLLSHPRLNRERHFNESLLGPSFFRMGEMGHDNCAEFREIRTDVVDNQIDTLTKAFQGLTVACARCHDHKLDPIPTTDYYALYGILASSWQVTRTLDTADAYETQLARMRQLKPLIRRELARIWKQDAKLLPLYLAAAAEPDSAPVPEALRPEQLKRFRAVLGDPKAGLSDPLYAWQALVRREQDVPFESAWRDVSACFRSDRDARAAFNREHFEPFGDFRGKGLDGWHPEGLGLQAGPSQAGGFAISGTPDRAVTGIFPAGIYTNLLSDRLNGALRSPYLPGTRKFISLQVLGGDLGARRLIKDNCVIGEDYAVLNSSTPGWTRFPMNEDDRKLPIYVELVTRHDNPRLPDRPGRLKDVTDEDLANPRSWFGIVRAVLHDVDDTPHEEIGHLDPLYEAGLPSSAGQLAERYAAILDRAIDAWASDRASDGDALWLNWFVERGLLSNSRDASPVLGDLLNLYASYDRQIREPRVAHGLADLEPAARTPLFRAGNPKNPGDPVPRHYLSLLGSPADRDLNPEFSGRLELASLVASPSNPLTARVMVNRLWHWVFGRGIVATPDNFGAYGEPPSHPGLLDYLADRFVREGWSTKKLLRLLVTSRAFRQSSTANPAAVDKDPQNRLLSYYPVRRLEAESIRDSILAVSGRLDPALFGKSIQPYRLFPKDYRKLLSGPLDGAGRRSLYLKVTRMEGPRFLEIFDFPEPAQTRGSRDVTNVAPQPLALLNDPFVIEQAEFWANSLIAEEDSSVDSRVDRMFRTALGRPADQAEQARFRGLAAEIASLRQVPRAEVLRSLDVWKDLAHAMFNLKEFVYVR